jgi:S1-C subfamily serine protease
MTSSIAERMNLPETQGFLVMSVVENGPAQKAGIRMGNKTEVIDGGTITVGGDIITHIDGKPVKKLEDLLNDLEYYKKPGDIVKLSIIRQGNNIELEANLGVRPAATTNK